MLSRFCPQIPDSQLTAFTPQLLAGGRGFGNQVPGCRGSTGSASCFWVLRGTQILPASAPALQGKAPSVSPSAESVPQQSRIVQGAWRGEIPINAPKAARLSRAVPNRSQLRSRFLFAGSRFCPFGTNFGKLRHSCRHGEECRCTGEAAPGQQVAGRQIELGRELPEESRRKEMNAAQPGRRVSCSWSIPKMSQRRKEAVCLLLNSEWSV